MIAHGALDHAELAALGIAPEALVDFSSNLNPFGPPAAVRAALAALDPAPYPDRSCRRLRLALAARHSCAPEMILAGNGANELIHLIARALLRPGDIAVVIGPTFGEYAHASRLAGADIVEVRGHERGQFLLDSDALEAAITRARPRITWLCAPNNPTGIDTSPDAILALAQVCATAGGLLLVDRAYGGFLRAPTPPLPLWERGAGGEGSGAPLDDLLTPPPPAPPPEGGRGADPNPTPPLPPLLLAQPTGEGGRGGEGDPSPPNLLQLYSLTKSYAIAGLRLGYLLAEPALVARVAALQPTWSVSSAAQVAGLAALADDSFLATSMPQLWAGSDALRAGLLGLGLRVHRAATPFMLVRVGPAPSPASGRGGAGQGWDAESCLLPPASCLLPAPEMGEGLGRGAATRLALLRRGYLVRDCASFGLPAWVRVSPQLPHQNTSLLAAWKEIL